MNNILETRKALTAPLRERMAGKPKIKWFGPKAKAAGFRVAKFTTDQLIAEAEAKGGAIVIRNSFDRDRNGLEGFILEYLVLENGVLKGVLENGNTFIGYPAGRELRLMVYTGK